MSINLVGPFFCNFPFGTEIAFAKGLKELGLEVFEVDPNVDQGLDGLDQSADYTVVFKSCVGNERHLKRLKGPIVTYQPDDARFPHIRRMMMLMRGYSDLFLSFDDYGARVAREMGYRAAETLLLTADPELYCPSPELIERDIDVSFVGSLGDPTAHASRRKMIELVAATSDKNGWKFSYGEHYFNRPGQFSPVQIYRSSKITLNHATDVGQDFGTGFGLQCRHYEAGMTGTALISNDTVGHYFDLPFYRFRSEETLLNGIEWMLGSDEETGESRWKQYGRKLRDAVMASHKPVDRASQLNDFMLRNA